MNCIRDSFRTSAAPAAQESMRRADEALGRQSSQAHGPSFVEAQERELARQAGGQLSSKMSCEWGPGGIGIGWAVRVLVPGTDAPETSLTAAPGARLHGSGLHPEHCAGPPELHGHRPLL